MSIRFVLTIALLAGCATDPNVIRYGNMACERTAQSADVPRRCWSVVSEPEKQQRDEKFGKEAPAK